MRCGQTAGSLKSANDLQWRLIAFAINAVALAPAILSAIEVDFRSKKTSLGKGESMRGSAKGLVIADGRAGRRPPRRSRGQRASPAETARRAVWPAVGIPDFAGAIKSGFAG